jgi:hypothetical protein
MWDIVIFTLGGCPGALVRFKTASPKNADLSVEARGMATGTPSRKTYILSPQYNCHCVYVLGLPLGKLGERYSDHYGGYQSQCEHHVGDPLWLDPCDIFH